MYTIANQLNKVTAYWTDDLRNLWGTSDDPLFIGMAPLPYKYLWLSGNNPDQDEKFDVQPKGLNGPDVIPSLASSTNVCPVVDKKKFEGRWNTFIDLLNRGAEDVQAYNSAGVSKRTQNLIDLGKAIIQYVETDKDNSKWGPGGWDPTKNTTLYWDMEYIITSNKNLLFPQEQDFISSNIDTPGNMNMNEGRPQFSVQSLHRFKNQPLINPGKDRTHELSRALGEGISKMVQKGS